MEKFIYETPAMRDGISTSIPVEYKYNKAEYFTDVEGKTHTITDLWFFDARLNDSITNGDNTGENICSWVYDNCSLLNVWASRVDMPLDSLRRFFDCNPSEVFRRSEEHLLQYLNPRRAYPLIDVSHLVSAGRGGSDILLSPDPEMEEEREVFSMHEIGTDGHLFVSSSRTSEDTPQDKWTKLHNYSFKMNAEEFDFFRRTPKDSEHEPTFGLELELSTKLSNTEIYRIVTEVEPKQKPFFIFKSDSSVNGCFENRVELVTVPCTPRYLKREFKIFFEKLEKLCAKKGFALDDVFDTSKNLNNGIHIHVGKAAFGVLDLHRRKFVTAFNQFDKTNVAGFTKVSGRPTERYCDNSYCAISNRHEGFTLARRLRRGNSANSRSVCHESNSATVEVRLYQGIVDIEHILRCIEFTEGMFHFTSQMGLSTFGRSFFSQFRKWVEKTNGLLTLKKFYKEV